MSLSFPRYHPWHPWCSSDFCDARRSSSSVALLSFHYVYCVELHLFYRSHLHSADWAQPFVFFKYLPCKISRSLVTLLMIGLMPLIWFRYINPNIHTVIWLHVQTHIQRSVHSIVFKSIFYLCHKRGLGRSWNEELSHIFIITYG